MNDTQPNPAAARRNLVLPILMILISVLVLYASLAGISFAMGTARIETAMVERGECQPAVCAEAVAAHYASYTVETGNPPELYRYCLGTQELATTSINIGLRFVIPAIRALLQFPCDHVYG